MKEFAQRLKSERKQYFWSQEQLAEKLGTNRICVSRWERGIALPSFHFRQKLTEILGKTAEELGLYDDVMDTEEKLTQDPQFEEVKPLSSPLHSSTFLWNLPYPRNVYFTGREEMFTLLDRYFTPQALEKSVSVVAISGLGGIGKTEFALEYVYRSSEKYQTILWIRAETHESLLTDVMAIAEVLHLVEPEQYDVQAVVTAVKTWLEQHKDWLIVLDNLEAFALLPAFFPLTNRGHILVTTRSQTTGHVAQRFDLPKMNTDEGALLLLRRAKQISSSAPLTQTDASEYITASAIAQILDGLPLAIDQAGAYIEEAGCQCAHYLDLLSYSESRLLDLRTLSGDENVKHPHSVSVTLSYSLERIKQANPAALELLSLCAFLHSEAIPEELFIQGKPDLSPLLQETVEDPLKFDSTIAELRKYSLIQRNLEEKNFSMHRLVQVVLKAKLDKASQRQWAMRAVQLVNHSFPEVDQWITSSQCQRYFSQAQVCVTLIDQWDIRSLEAGRLLLQLSCYLYELSQYQLIRYSQAEPLLKMALKIFTQLEETNQTVIADTLQFLGWVYTDRGDYAKAEHFCQQALAIQKSLPDPDHWRIACFLADLAETHEGQGKYVSAELFYRQAAEINEQVRGTEHLDVAINLRNWGRCYSRQKKYEQAEPLLLRALSIWQQRLGKEHPVTATICYELGQLYQEQRQYSQAETFLLQAQKIRQKLLHPKHSHMIASLNLLTRFYQEQEQYEKTKPLPPREERGRIRPSRIHLEV